MQIKLKPAKQKFAELIIWYHSTAILYFNKFSPNSCVLNGLKVTTNALHSGPSKAHVLTQLMATLSAELAQGQLVEYRAVRSLSVAGVLSVGIVVSTPSVAVVKDLLLTCTHAGLEMTYKISGVASTSSSPPSAGSDYVLTILSPHSHIPATCYRDFCQVLSNFDVNITKIINLSDKNNKKKSCAVEFVVNVPAGKCRFHSLI
jgi:hypothetical protein